MHHARRPKLGQHFLHDVQLSRKIANLLPFRRSDLLVEIGPGRGALTRLLASRARRLAAIELDPLLVKGLRDEFRQNPGVEIIEGDVLKISFDELCERYGAATCDVFGNLPYYITSPILRHLLAARARIRHLTLLVQKELARRITAMPGSRDYGYLTVLVQCFSRPQILLEIAPGGFSPPPKVRSALVDLEVAARFPHWGKDAEEGFLRFTRASFGQKRKKLVNNLAYSRSRVEAALEASGVGPQARAEELSIEQLAALFEALAVTAS